MYRDEVERVSGWETSRMRMATDTTTKGGRGRVVQRQRHQKQKCDEEVQDHVGNNHVSLLILLRPPPDGFELGTNVGKKLGFFDGKVLVTTLGVADGITLGIYEGTELGSSDGSSDGSN